MTVFPEPKPPPEEIKAWSVAPSSSPGLKGQLPFKDKVPELLALDVFAN